MSKHLATRIAVWAILLITGIAAWSNRLDAPAMEEVDAGMARALAGFAAARGLNAAISLAQGTQVSAGIGASVTVSVGEVLDPVNDMVESFSQLMLLASVAFGIQKVLLLIGQDVLVRALFTAVLAAWGSWYLLAGKRHRWLDAALVIALMVRFAIPAVTLASDVLYERFLHENYTRSSDGIASTTVAISAASEDLRARQPDGNPSGAALEAATPSPPASRAAPPPEPGLLDRIRGAVDDNVRALREAAARTTEAVGSAVAELDPRAYLEKLEKKAAAATDHIIDLMVVFLLQTVLVPIFLLWAMYAVLRGVLTETVMR